MNNLRYALASASYYKKSSFFFSLIFFVFLSVLTGILNLIDININSFQQIERIDPNSNYFLHHKDILKAYYSIFAVIFILFILIFSILTFISIRKKKQELFKWRLMGFSTFHILKQHILETLFLIFVGAFFSAIFMIIFQHTYEGALTSFGKFFTNVTNHQYSFFTENTIIDATPNVLTNSDKVTYFFDIGLASLPVTMITIALQKNVLLISFSAIVISSLNLIFFLFINKKSRT